MKIVYYLPGRDSGVSDEVGRTICHLGVDVVGRDLLPEFINYRIGEQVEIIKQDIANYFAEHDGILLARSYGAFLLLQALIELNPFRGRILLFSPVLGPTNIKAAKGPLFFRPPRANKLLQFARNATFPAPEYMEIHTGSEDLQCHPSIAVEFAHLVPNTRLYLVQGGGHGLDHKYTENILKKFLLM